MEMMEFCVFLHWNGQGFKLMIRRSCGMDGFMWFFCLIRFHEQKLLFMYGDWFYFTSCVLCAIGNHVCCFDLVKAILLCFSVWFLYHCKGFCRCSSFLFNHFVYTDHIRRLFHHQPTQSPSLCSTFSYLVHVYTSPTEFGDEITG